MNRLVSETSLYLRQHADNPVDWYPWGDEALAEARRTGKPIFLSVGYSACHWCHVMAHESFESGETAAVMNEHFINIKVDREERPDLDQIYMTAHGLLTRGEGGGWPLSVWMTAELKPFYAGTYFPPREKYGRPSFKRVLLSIAHAWNESREKLVEVGEAVANHFRDSVAAESDANLMSEVLLTNAASYLNRAFDTEYGGFGRAPKFPHALDLQLLLRTSQRFGRANDLEIVRGTLEKMARGGMYDQIGGGFHRYSVDREWLVPHFEKMLYDNALLPPVYVELFQLTGDRFFESIARETLDYVLREMTSEPGGFYSTQDADSEGEEGKFFVWSEAELDTVLGTDLALFARRVFGTSETGNFEGHNILFRWRSDADDATGLGISLEEFRQKLGQVKCQLYGARAKRVWPGRDEKLLTAWNGLMIHAFAMAGAVLREPRYIAAARKAAEFVLNQLRTADGRLFRTCGIGQPAKLSGYLDDYAFFSHGLVSLYEATFEPEWIEQSLAIVEQMNRHFSDPAGGYFYTADDHETLLTRSKDIQDGSTPSGNAIAALTLVRLSYLTGWEELRQKAETTIQAHTTVMAEHPMAAAQMLMAFNVFDSPVEEIAVIGQRGEEETERVLTAVRSSFRPGRVVAFHDPRTGPVPQSLSLLNDRPLVENRVTTYICRNRVCSAPLVGAEAVEHATR
ncbi:MAG: thioredoxin domain-containing protein [Gemmataceae bacterium]